MSALLARNVPYLPQFVRRELTRASRTKSTQGNGAKPNAHESIHLELQFIAQTPNLT